MKLITSLLLLSSIFLSPACKKAFWESDCDGVQTFELDKSIHHQIPNAVYEQGEKLNYTLCPTPSPCGGGDYTFLFKEIDCNNHQVGEDYLVLSWVEECGFTGIYSVSHTVTRKIDVSILNLKGKEVYHQEFPASQ